jgi:DNA-binding SARP family transcriptional activator
MGASLLRIQLLGELDLRNDAVTLPPLDSTRAQSLLAYLLLHRRAPQSRQHVAFLLWPDSSESQARTNLRHVLHNLRRALPDPDRFLDVTPRTLQWRVDAPYWLDVAAFEEALARAEHVAADAVVAALQEAVKLYTGDLLAGAYDEWLLAERERLRQRFLDALERLAALLEARGDYTQAIQHAERLLRHDALHEETYRLLMRLHDARGDRARAMRVYHACVAALDRELSVEPSARTRATYEALLPLAQGLWTDERQTDAAGGSPFIGRVSERNRLTDIWRAAEGGRAQFVLVTGEPGVGKTRLVEEFASWCDHRGALVAVARSYPAEGALAYGPVVEWLRSAAFHERLERLDPAYQTELARLLPELLVRVPGLAPPEPLPESDQRQRLFDAVARAILAAGLPLVLVADDLHWGDRETLRLLHYLPRVAPEAQLLIVATARREEIDQPHPLNELVTGLQALECCAEIELGRLSRHETLALAERLVRSPIEAQAADRLYGETEGNPLFVVEAVRAGWIGGPAERGSLSPRVQAVIQSRLVQLSEPARALAGLAATIGREFTTDVLADASEAGEDALVRGLDELWRRRIVRESGIDAYDFSHDRIREVAYLALSPVVRRHHHLRVARALERLHAGDLGAVSGQLAAHYDRAGAAGEAVAWYVRAAQVALQLHANAEAIRLLVRALDLLQARPETPERQRLELSILTALPSPLVSVEGYLSPRVTDVHERALALTRALGIEPASPLLRSLALANLSRGDFDSAQRFGRQLLVSGERDADQVLLVQSRFVLGVAAFWHGEFDDARAHFEAAVENYRDEHRPTHLLQYGHDPKVVCLMRLGFTLWFLGCPESATSTCDAALELAGAIGHPYSRAVASIFAAMLALELRDTGRLRLHAAVLASGDAPHEAAHVQVTAEAVTGYLDVLDGAGLRGIAVIQRALEDARASEEAPGQDALIARVLLEACAAAGEVRVGIATADRMLATAGGTRIWEAEFRRLRAEFLAALGAADTDIEAELDRALLVARSQGAMLLELRVATSILRRGLARGDVPGTREARDRLAAIIAALSEGRETPDVRAAVALLAGD